MSGNRCSNLIILDLGCNKPPPHTLTSGRLFRAKPDGSHIETIVSGQSMPDAVAISHREGRIYWTNMGFPGAADGSIWSSLIDGTDIRNIVRPGEGLNTPKQLTLDEEARKIFVCDREGLKIIRCNFDGSQIETLISTGEPDNPEHKSDATRWCVGLAIDQIERTLYWTQRGPSKSAQGRIFRADLDMPTNRDAWSRQDIHCVIGQLPEPVDLDIDLISRKLFWTDRGETPHGNSLNCCNLDQLDSKNPLLCRTLEPTPYQVLTRNLHEPIGLKVDLNNRCVWVADMGGAIYRIDLDTGGKLRMYEELEACFSGIDFC